MYNAPSISASGLSVTAFLARAQAVFGDRIAVIDGEWQLTYTEFADRVARLVTALSTWGLSPGDRVAVVCANSHIMLELHHALPIHGAVLVPLNTRLSAGDIGLILDHSGTEFVVTTDEFAALVAQATERRDIRTINADDPDGAYEATLAKSVPADIGNHRSPSTEDGLLAINYTSGTTGWPKGVMYSHRGAYLQSVAMAYHAGLSPDTRYLWTLPMFHCNGWCFTWAVTAVGGTHICLRSTDTRMIWTHLRDNEITHLCAAPTVLTMIAEDSAAAPLPAPVAVSTGGSPPTPALLQRAEALGLHVTHLYGMTETYGPIVVNWWQREWDVLSQREISVLRARQGIGNLIAEQPRVIRDDGSDVAADGAELGELIVRGNNVMLGYYLDEQATAGVTIAGWLRTGDLAVVHPDGYLELRDRVKDIIISGGENIASVEIESVLNDHPDVIECAVVARGDARWGEVPIAYVTRRRDTLTETELVDFCRDRLARFKAPKAIVFGELPKNATGKIQKHVLRSSHHDSASARTAT